MHLFSYFRQEVLNTVETLITQNSLPQGMDTVKITAEPPREASHGDVSTNVAMILAKSAGESPRQIAEKVMSLLSHHPDIQKIEIAGPGFINMWLSDSFWCRHLSQLVGEGQLWPNIGQEARVNVEYVSVNPTGPMHAGHGRGAVFGDVLATLLSKVGYHVTKEYYINDGGGQIDVLARSTYMRYLEALGEPIGEIPAGLYPGSYLQTVGTALVAQDQDKWRGKPEQEWLEPIGAFTVRHMMALIRQDLAALGIYHDVFTSENDIVAQGKIEQVIGYLKEKDLIYTGTLTPPKGKTIEDWEPHDQLLFRSQQFGDDSDRPLQRSDGTWTYFAKDIAYHYDKYQRGYRSMIDVLGADHGGYVKRLQAAVQAFSEGTARVDVKVCQLVNFVEAGVPVKMSKRAGTLVYLRDVIDHVGKDVVRFMMLMRKNDAPLDFDFVKVLDQSKDNPIFYIQYAHARVCSVMRLVTQEMPSLSVTPQSLQAASLDLLEDGAEKVLIKKLADWGRQVETAALMHEPHRLAFYLCELAADFHMLWNRGKDNKLLRFIVADNPALTLARLALIQVVGHTISQGLQVFGIEAVEEMR